MSKKVKLTGPQWDLLMSVRRRQERVVATYKPALRLAELGLVITKQVNPPFGLVVQITDAGRALLPTPETPDA